MIWNIRFWTPPSSPLVNVELVFDLIDSSSSSWKGDIIKQLYPSQDSLVHFSLPPSLIKMEDKLCWSLDSKGIYKVATTYRILTDPLNRCSV